MLNVIFKCPSVDSGNGGRGETTLGKYMSRSVARTSRHFLDSKSTSSTLVTATDKSLQTTATTMPISSRRTSKQRRAAEWRHSTSNSSSRRSTSSSSASNKNRRGNNNNNNNNNKKNQSSRRRAKQQRARRKVARFADCTLIQAAVSSL